MLLVFKKFCIHPSYEINWFNHTSWMIVVTPTDRPKSVHNRCVIEGFDGILCCPLVFEFSVGIGVFVIGLSDISFFFFSYEIKDKTIQIALLYRKDT